MKTLIAYYSRTAKELQGMLKCDIEEIADTKDRTGRGVYLTGSIQAIRKKVTKIKPTLKDPSIYDLVIMLYPIWAGRMPPAARAYIMNNRSKFKSVTLVSVSGGGKSNKEKTIPDFIDAIGKKPVASLLLSDKELKNSSYKEELEGFLNNLKI